MKPTYYIIAGLVLIIILMIVFWPSKPPQADNQAFKNRIEQLNQEKAEISSRLNAQIEGYQDSLKAFESIVSAKESKIKVLSRKLADNRPEVQPILDTIPILKLFVEQQDSLIRQQSELIDTLRSNVEFHKKSFDDLVKISINERRVNEEMETAQTKRIEELQKLNERTFKGKTFWKKLAGIGGIVILVETGILAIQ